MIQPRIMDIFTPNQSSFGLPDATLLHPPLSLDSINNPRRRPKVIILKIDQELNNLITLGRICNQGSPDEDGVAYSHR
jgi:hypothetical protein